MMIIYQSFHVGNIAKPVLLESATCTVGSMRASITGDPSLYEICIHKSASNSVWLDRKCPYGTMYSSLTSNCGQHHPNERNTHKNSKKNNVNEQHSESDRQKEKEHYEQVEFQQHSISETSRRAIEQQYIIEAINRFLPEVQLTPNEIRNKILGRYDSSQALHRDFGKSIGDEVKPSQREIALFSAQTLLELLHRTDFLHNTNVVHLNGRAILDNMEATDMFIGELNNTDLYVRRHV